MPFSAKSFTSCFFLFFTLLVWPGQVQAIVNPLTVPNNRIGVHILDPQEITSAAKLVNSSGGAWGYVTVPIRADDRDVAKWREFFTKCNDLHVIPIIRLAMYVDGDAWVSPSSTDLVDFALFLNDMPWPTRNRYIVLFNEPNHSNEWGREISPQEYVNLVVDAHAIFKPISVDFFLISAGLDMSAPSTSTSSDALKYYRAMTLYRPDWGDFIDGLAVHAYPNPGFSASPFSTNRFGITSYRYELSLLEDLKIAPKPIFITETGTIKKDDFYTPAFTQVWTDSNIVAITPFLLFAGAGAFTDFSLLDPAGQPTFSYLQIQKLPKSVGSPLLSPLTIPTPTPGLSSSSDSTSPPAPKPFIDRLKDFFSSGKRNSVLTIGSTRIPVELASTPSRRQQGLSDRKQLPSDSGMLFVFPQAAAQMFWMKDMHFALDFLWIHQGKVIQIDTHIPPPGPGQSPRVVKSTSPVDQVLEVNAGFVDSHGLKVGDLANLQE